jgi:hypothetical protein
MSQTQFNPTEMIFHKYLANHQVCFLVTDESYRVEQAIKAAAKRLNTERYADDKKASSRVSVMVHDKYCGFYEGLPTLSQPADKTDLPLVALQVMLDDMAGINKTNSQIKKLAFEPADNIIFVLKDWEGALLGNPVVVQALRNMIQSNMGSKERFMTDDGHGRATRGKRMLVFVTTNERIPNTLPELKSFTVPLPNDTILGEVVDNVFEPLAELHKETKGKEGLKAPDKPTRQTLITAMQGSTYQFAEDTLTLTLARHRNLDNMDDVLRTIEREKAAYIAGVPGLVYIPTHGITNAAQLPGYEAAVKFLLDRKGIDPDEARKRSIQPLKGMTLAGAPGVGKCLGRGTMILMYDGTRKKVEEVLVEDLLMGPDSTPRKVLSLARGREEMYKVHPVKGESYVVNKSHILSLKTSPKRAGEVSEIVNMSVTEYLSLSNNERHHLKGWRTSVEWDYSHTSIDPYILGVWLGNGNSSGASFTINDLDEEVVDALRDYAVTLDLNFTTGDEGSGCKTYRICKDWGGNDRDGNHLLRMLRTANVINNKHVPHTYLANSRNVRMNVLAGLLDTDGHLVNNCYEISTKYPALADNIEFLARSLGFATTMNCGQKTCTNTGAVGLYWRIFISGDVCQIPLRAERKKAQSRQQKKNVLVTGITVEPIGEDEYFGFTIDGDHLFVLGDFTVTHNTMFGKATASLMGRILLLWNLGESQGSLVGDSEANTRRAIQIAQAMHAVILLDDVDKAGVKAASGASETAIEGGPFGRMIQMLLTEMSSENNNAIWIFTCNRINNLPPELIRPGRMDERFFVQRPDSETRERILRTHIEKRLWPIGDEKMIGLLSDDTTTQGWTGAELEDLVAKASIHALTNGRKELDYRWMMQQGKVTTPMIKQGAYAKDIQDMEGFCDTWTKIGRIDRKVATDVKGRSSRSTEV